MFLYSLYIFLFYDNIIINYGGLIYDRKGTDKQKEKIEKTEKAILDARKLYKNCSFAQLYNELTMPLELRKAHQENDKAVMEAYGFDWRNMTESHCVAELMRMYQKVSKKIKVIGEV